MKIITKISVLIIALFALVGCQDMVEGINEDPNKVTTVDGNALFTGIQLADVASQNGFLTWAGGVSCGYFVGSGRLQYIQNYEYVNTDSDTPWSNIYVGVVKQARQLRSGISVTNKDFFYGASKVLEAHAIATATNVFGDVPFSEAGNNDIPQPKYDAQTSIYTALQEMLDEAISNLQTSGTTGGITEDIFFEGDASKWIKVAYTLKARLYLDVRDYSNAIVATQKGISTVDETMAYNPPNVAGGGDINLLNSLLSSSTFGGDVAVENSYLITLLSTGSRNNTKTDESDRVAYYYSGTSINNSDGGIAAADASMNQISLQENLLTWAEAAIRTGDFTTALQKLNEHRTNLRNGVYFPVTTTAKYEDYVEADFVSGGIENTSGLTKENALLKEVLEERYVTFFTEVLGFNDMRRVEKDTPVSVQVAIPYNKGTKHPQRFLYPFTEENTNGANTPDITDIFVKTEVNQ